MRRQESSDSDTAERRRDRGVRGECERAGDTSTECAERGTKASGNYALLSSLTPSH